MLSITASSVLICVILFSKLPAFSMLCVPDEQYEYLRSFYNSLHGSGWLWKNVSSFGKTWDFTVANEDPCEYAWQGITCQSCQASTSVPRTCSHCNITELRLPSYNLKGSIPNDIQNLSYLRHIDLSENSIISTLPSTLFNITNLETLELGYNSLIGNVPDSISKLTRLSFLRIRNNFLNGTIPSSLAHLQSSLLNLNLRGNQLSGTLPSELGLLTNLQIVAFFMNKLTGTLPASYGNWSKVISIYL